MLATPMWVSMCVTSTPQLSACSICAAHSARTSSGFAALTASMVRAGRKPSQSLTAASHPQSVKDVGPEWT